MTFRFAILEDCALLAELNHQRHPFRAGVLTS